MSDILLEEKGNYGIDCKNAIWYSGEMHTLYHKFGLSDFLCDADFVIETEDIILLVEYKNANIPEARTHANGTNEYDPFASEKFKKIIRKYYDSLHYLHLQKKEKPIRYIFVLEYPKGDSVSRKMLRNRLKKRLPFGLQEHINSENELIHSVDVLSIEEWNGDELLGQYPIVRCV